MKIVIVLLVILIIFCLINFWLYYQETKNRCFWNLTGLSPNIDVSYYILFTKNGSSNKIDDAQVVPTNSSLNTIQQDFYQFAQNFMATNDRNSRAVLLSNYLAPINLTAEDVRRINGRLSF